MKHFTNRLVVKCPNNSIACCNNVAGSSEGTPQAVNVSQNNEEPINKIDAGPFFIELTVTLKPFMYAKTLDEQIKCTKRRMIDALRGFKKSVVIELTKEYNIHYHCILVEKKISSNPFLRLTDRFRKEKWAGRKSIRGVQYYDSYVKYMNKDIKNTNKCISSSAIVIDDFDILGHKWEELDEEGEPILHPIVQRN